MNTRNEKELLALCDRIRQIAYDLHIYLGHGHLEKVYENGLSHRLRKTGLRVSQQCPIQVRDKDGTMLGDYYVDLLVEETLIVELKACRTLSDEHTAQALGYLRASSLHDALLINFGSPRLQIKKFIF
jgi:GxxExxY protein